MEHLSLQKELIPILAVALITWGGVLLYLWRLENLVKSLEAKVADQQLQNGGA